MDMDMDSRDSKQRRSERSCTEIVSLYVPFSIYIVLGPEISQLTSRVVTIYIYHSKISQTRP